MVVDLLIDLNIWVWWSHTKNGRSLQVGNLVIWTTNPGCSQIFVWITI